METIEKTVGQIVADNYKTAAVFESFGIDFCCKGNKTIDEACDEKSISKTLLIHDLNKVTLLKNENNTNEDYNSWEPSILAEHIENKHHKYVEEKTPLIKHILIKYVRFMVLNTRNSIRLMSSLANRLGTWLYI